MAGFYIHLPFCGTKCHYCDFVTAGAGSASSRADFLRLLEKEIAHRAPGVESTTFETLYVGGGTPSVLTLPEMTRVIRAVRKHFKFRAGAEVTCEANPGDIDEAKARGFRELGFNRMSLGAQTFHDATLKRLNRSHGADGIFTAFEALRRAGFENINLDLMLALPGETPDHVRHSLTEAVKLEPGHVSLYELVIEPHTVFGRRFQKGRLTLPDETAAQEMLLFARGFLVSSGFRHYELLNYAKPGSESRHNLIYWTNGEYLGLGPGAYSYLGGRRFRNAASVHEYMAKIERGDWSACEEETLSEDAKEIESFLLALRRAEGAPVSRFAGLMRRLETTINDLKNKDLLKQEADAVRLSPRGQLFAETVFAELSLC